MAFLIPSYFQKRLLRYALSRLDFLETDQLDLENLDIAFGQRSVIELKDVGIQIRKLTAALPLPPYVTLNSARVKNLRVTIPADLNRSGIDVEIIGVDVQVQLEESDDNGAVKNTQLRTSAAPSKSDKANRPRISSPQIYDPGGHTIPTSEVLAMSFLQSEPIEEKHELEAAIASRSQYLQESALSTSGNISDTGLGAPGGLSLPTFVTTFFQGVADRLSVQIKDINIMANLGLPHDLPQQSDTLRLMLKVAEVKLKGLQSHSDVPPQVASRREIAIDGIEVILLSDSELLQPASQVSSPRLTKSRTPIVSPRASGSPATSEALRSSAQDLQQGKSNSYPDLTASTPTSDSSTASLQQSPPFASTIGLGLEDDGAEIGKFAQPSTPTKNSSTPSMADSLSASMFHETDNRAHAEQLIKTQSLEQVPSHSSGGSSGPEDLSESKYFTHDQAESMYLSAIGGDSINQSSIPAMPGAWNNFNEPSEPQLDSMQASQNKEASVSSMQGTSTVAQAPSATATAATPETSTTRISISNTVHVHLPVSQLFNSSTLTAKRLVFFSSVKIALPAPQDSGNTSQFLQPLVSKAEEASAQRHPLRSSELFASRILPGTEPRTLSGERSIDDTSTQEHEGIGIDVGHVTVAVDLAVGRLVARVLPTFLRYSASISGNAKTLDDSSVSQFVVRCEQAFLQICETLSDFDLDHLSTATKILSDPEDILLQIVATHLSFRNMLSHRQALQNFSVERLAVGNENHQFLSFRDSIHKSATRSSLLRRNDVSVTIRPESAATRVDVKLKPIHIHFDLLQLDDILSRSGGLSSILGLGNSVVSTSTVKETPPMPKPPRHTPRTVRFEGSQRPGPQEEVVPRTAFKLDLYAPSCTLDLTGSEQSIKFQTSTIKVAYRQQLAGVMIDWLEVTGPTPRGQKPQAPIVMSMTDVDVRYLLSPEQVDLDRLLALVAPSKDKFDKDDDIMVDTLLRQRRKGSVLRLEIAELNADLDQLDWQTDLLGLADELSRLSSVSKYLPDDDRPGLLTFGLVKNTSINLALDQDFGFIALRAELLEGALISVPSLMASQVASISLSRNDKDTIFGPSQAFSTQSLLPPLLMCRFIADEMEPTVNMRLANAKLEYEVSTLVAFNKALEKLNTPEKPSPSESASPARSESSAVVARKTGFSIHIKDSTIGLSPAITPAKALLVLSDAFYGLRPGRGRDNTTAVDIKKASVMVIDDRDRSNSGGSVADSHVYFDESDQIQQLAELGFVPVGNIASASAVIRSIRDKGDDQQSLDIEFHNNLLILETCADSTQTLIQVLSNLSLPTPPSISIKYRTEVMPITDMLNSFTGDAYIASPGPDAGHRVPDKQSPIFQEEDYHEAYGADEEPTDEDDFYPADDTEAQDDLEGSYVDSDLGQSLSDSIAIAPVGLTESVASSANDDAVAHSLLDFRDNHFTPKTSVGGTAHRWDSKRNTYDLGDGNDVRRSPLRVRVRDVHIIWNLFDGFDWQSTRDVIAQAVKDVELKAAAKRPRSNNRLSPRLEDDDESVIGDFLFNSIYIGIPAGKNPRDLAKAINHDIDDMVSETGSYATTTTVTGSPTRRPSSSRTKRTQLKLNRSKQHKMTFEVKGVSADFLMFPSGSSEVESSIDVRVRDLEIFDHVPTSTWKKFATYMQDAGEREVDTNMLHLEILNVKPVPDLAATEMILKVTVLPLRLHVDQDALDFMTRFFEFKDDKAPAPSTPSTPPFLQRVEVNPVRVKLDFKPKRVDYGGIRSGRTTEFMNFIVLDRADMVLRRVILYGVSGFDRMGVMLNSIWMPDVKRNQLPGILKGLAPIRPLVDVGSGLQQIVAVPMTEYRKDGRIVRSIQKGAIAFASTTAKELVNLGAKLAIGTQTVLQNAEQALSPGEEDSGESYSERKQISLYANQPVGIVQGLRGAWASLERDLLLAKDAVVAVPGEVMASGSATGAARAVLKSSPTIILRPAIGASKAIGQTLMGAGNALDKRNLRRIDEKYKRDR